MKIAKLVSEIAFREQWLMDLAPDNSMDALYKRAVLRRELHDMQQELLGSARPGAAVLEAWPRTTDGGP